MRALFAPVLACVAALTPMCAKALDSGYSTKAPVAVSAAAPIRQALIVAPAPSGGAMAPDADAYSSLLSLLGFSVTTIVAETRPELEGGLRRFAASVRPGGEVALLVLGSMQARGKDLYLSATASVPELASHPELLATEGVAFSDVLARIEAQGAKDLVAIVDTCRAGDGASDCRQVAAALPDGVSAIVASRRHGADAGAPMARLGSLRSEVLPLMAQPDLSFFAMFAALKDKLAGTDMTLAATPSLSRSFAFLPGDFLARLPTDCNRVDATADPAALAGRKLDGLVAACAAAARSYGFSPFFTTKLAIVREQAAFQRTTAKGCDAFATADFLNNYPNGRLRDAVERSRTDCETAQRVAAQHEADLRSAAQQEQTWRNDTARELAQREDAQRRLTRSNGLVDRGDIQPSFICTPVLREPVAQLICADADLAAADAELGLAYRRVFASAAPTSRHALALAESAWTRQRDIACGIPMTGTWDIDTLAPNKACLLRQTRQRTAELEH